MELECIRANVTAQFTPEWNTIQMLVNTSWPHADNIIERATDVFTKIFSSFQSVCLFIALVIAFWPAVQKRLGFVSDKINRAKGDKVEIELQKFVAAHTLTLAALNRQAMRPTAPGTQQIADDTPQELGL